MSTLESPRYPIPSYFNPTPYYVYKAVRQLLDRDDIPPCNIKKKKKKNIHFFTKILHYGKNAENRYNDYIKNQHLLSECGNICDEELDHSYAAQTYFLKSALNMLRDYVDSIAKVQNGVENESDKVSFFEDDIFEVEVLIERM